MRLDIVTLFPELFETFLRTSIIGRAVEQQLLQVRFQSPREYGVGRHKSVDDTPYGGGAGMVMRVDCLVACLESFDADLGDSPRSRRILLTPRGVPFTQQQAVRLVQLPALALVCGRYEGFDERVHAYVDEEISLGDFVLAGGELAAMVVIETIARLLPGVLGNEQSARDESYGVAGTGLLEYPQYTRPPEFRGAAVPEVLIGGHHARIAEWRQDQARQKTAKVRPDLLKT